MPLLFQACSVGSTPGVTKAMQEVQLDSKVKLLDSPGVVLASGDMKSDASVALRNAIRTGTEFFTYIYFFNYIES